MDYLIANIFVIVATFLLAHTCQLGEEKGWLGEQKCWLGKKISLPINPKVCEVTCRYPEHKFGAGNTILHSSQIKQLLSSHIPINHIILDINIVETYIIANI